MYSGFLDQFPCWISVLGVILLAVILGFFAAPLIVWSILILAVVYGAGASAAVLLAAFAVLLVFNLPPLRRNLISRGIMAAMKKILPKISETERTALEAGVVWSEAELFSGRPDFKKVMDQPYPQLSAEEKAFMEGPVSELCSMVNDWEIFKNREIPENVMNFIKQKGFLGMIIPKEYGGLGFSNFCHSEVVMIVSTRSIAVSITVMVPNSLGPAELLIHYGTDAQKKRWLPRLARGEEMPCFGLTEPQAGSDAGSITSDGVLFKGDDGQIYIRLNWRKRWITLAAISTVIGLAFRLRDPDGLLGGEEDLGITCALIPSSAEGVVLGKRHDPLAVPFYNCPTEGHNVVVNAEEAIIGGLKGAGKGWSMLMESLAAGRGISLPAQSTGGLHLASRVASAHANIRKQFGVSIGKFEGVEEPLARLGGTTYLLEAMRRYTLSALDQGIKPPVVTAIAKYNATELGRRGANDAMDILGGAGISMGPRNLLAIPYISMPIAITVEGANILTRTLIVFGQGALRAHPYAYKEIDAVEKKDLVAFDRAFWGHIGHVVHNSFRAFVLSLSRGYLGRRGYGHGMGRFFQKLDWASASFAITADLAMALLGGSLKFRERLTGRFADILSYMYMATAILRRYQADGYRVEDRPFAKFALVYCFSEMQKSFEGIYQNFRVPVIGWLFTGPLRWWSNLNSLGSHPSDKLGHEVVSLMLQDSDQRDRLFYGVYMPKEKDQQVAKLEHTLEIVKRAEKIERKLRDAVKTRALPKIKGAKLIAIGLEKSVITAEEAETLKRAEEARWDAIQVDDFTEEEYRQSTGYVSRTTTIPM